MKIINNYVHLKHIYAFSFLVNSTNNELNLNGLVDSNCSFFCRKCKILFIAFKSIFRPLKLNVGVMTDFNVANFGSLCARKFQIVSDAQRLIIQPVNEDINLLDNEEEANVVHESESAVSEKPVSHRVDFQLENEKNPVNNNSINSRKKDKFSRKMTREEIKDIVTNDVECVICLCPVELGNANVSYNEKPISMCAEFYKNEACGGCFKYIHVECLNNYDRSINGVSCPFCYSDQNARITQILKTLKK